MMKSRKGALELSMNTIVVIVIAAIVLSMGIVFVRSMFNKVSDFGDSAFEKAEGSIGDITNYDGLLTLSPGEISVKKGGSKAVSVIVANQDYPSLSFKLKTTSSEASLKCAFADTISEVSKTYTLESGEEASIKLLVKDANGALGTKVCSVEVQGNQRLSDNSDELIVEIVKE